MINVNELMLYSIIDTPIGLRKVKGLTVKSADDATIEVDNGTTHDAKLCSGVVLTAEWLERCGFEYKDGADEYGHYRHNLVYIYEHDEDAGFFHDSLGPFKGKRIEITNLHQLQRLYFDLTGEELKIEL